MVRLSAVILPPLLADNCCACHTKEAMGGLRIGFKALENPVHVHDLHATIVYLMGIDHEKLTYRYSGRDFRLTDVHGNVVREILEA